MNTLVNEIKKELQDAITAIEHYENAYSFLSPMAEGDTICSSLIDKARNDAAAAITNLAKYLTNLNK